MTLPELSPEVERLLRDVAEDPQARFFEATPRQVILAMREMAVPAASVAEIDRTAAERELLRTHREELAKLLRDACVVGLCQDPRAVRERYFTGPGKPPERGDLERRVPRFERHHEPHFRDDGETEDASTLLKRVLGRRPDEPWPIQDLAVHSLRLAPSFQARVYLAIDSSWDRRYRSAQRTLGLVLRENAAGLARSFAAGNLGVIRFRLGRRDEGLALLRSALRGVEPSPWVTLNWFTLALILGRKEQALEAARLLDDTVPSNSDAITSFLRIWSRSTALTGWRAPGRCLRVLSIIESSLGPTSSKAASVVRQNNL